MKNPLLGKFPDEKLTPEKNPLAPTTPPPLRPTVMLVFFEMPNNVCIRTFIIDLDTHVKNESSAPQSLLRFKEWQIAGKKKMT